MGQWEKPELHYDCNRSALPADLAAGWLPLCPDGESRAFIERALQRPHGDAARLLYGVLRRFLSDFDAYGMLGILPMHLLSAAQWAQLCASATDCGARRLLDVGAGDGAITARGADLFEQVWATEASRVMQGKLRKRGFEVLDQDLCLTPLEEGVRFDVVSCFNVLDRCSHPRDLVEHMQAALSAQGLLLLSVPLPLRPHVQVGGHTVDPEQTLPRADGGWEQQAGALYRGLFEPAGLSVRSLSRIPYLCAGSKQKPLSALDAALFVLTKTRSNP